MSTPKSAAERGWGAFTRITIDVNGERWVNESDALRTLAARDAEVAELVADIKRILSFEGRADMQSVARQALAKHRARNEGE